MTIGGYEVPMIKAMMPFALGILFFCTIKIFAGRMWNDKDIDLKKMGLVGASIGLVFFIVLSINMIVIWIGGIIGKAMEMINKIQV